MRIEAATKSADVAVAVAVGPTNAVAEAEAVVTLAVAAAEGVVVVESILVLVEAEVVTLIMMPVLGDAMILAAKCTMLTEILYWGPASAARHGGVVVDMV